MSASRETELEIAEIASDVECGPHPESLNPGNAILTCCRGPKGVASWPTAKLSRLHLQPSSRFGQRFLDYGYNEGDQAIADRDRVRARVLASRTVEEALAVVDGFWESGGTVLMD